MGGFATYQFYVCVQACKIRKSGSTRVQLCYCAEEMSAKARVFKVLHQNSYGIGMSCAGRSEIDFAQFSPT